MKRTNQDTRDAVPADDQGADEPRSRRQLLKLASGAAIGGGLVLAGAGPAGAADNDPLLIGNPSNTSDGDFTGLNVGLATGSLAVGTSGMTDASALVGAANGTGSDLKLAGTGRLGFSSTVSTGNAAPSGTLVMDALGMSTTGVLWAGKSDDDSWRRINAVRVDHPNGTGAAFAPFRLYDSRNTSIRAVGGTTHVDVHASANIPDDAIAVFGNLTVTGPTFSGWVNLWPRGVSEPATSSINFNTGQTVANFFFVGLGTGSDTNNGFISFGPRKSGTQSGSTHVIIDITAYVQ
jgi:hypothetical protein